MVLGSTVSAAGQPHEPKGQQPILCSVVLHAFLTQDVFNLQQFIGI